MDIVPASNFTFEQLTEAYNQTRVDYLVPMPMNTARLREYARVYDVSLEHSAVARDEDGVLYGLGMLGVREKRAWITRLGVLPNGRRRGTGSAIMESLLAGAERSGADITWLEVIKGNDPAHQLFLKYGFKITRELIVARRPPNPEPNPEVGKRVKSVRSLDEDGALHLLTQRKQRPNWLNEIESLRHVHNLSALVVECHDGSRGWVTYHAGLLQLTRILVEISAGDPVSTTETVLHVLHQRHKRQDAVTENLFDPQRWEGFQRAGYFDSFRRIEMKRAMA
jgi:ribosomal protein S18 acetylase RimI-like enzyme